jgi:hypothetical protein
VRSTTCTPTSGRRIRWRPRLSWESHLAVAWDNDLIVKSPCVNTAAAPAPGVAAFSPDGEVPMSTWSPLRRTCVAEGRAKGLAQKESTVPLKQRTPASVDPNSSLAKSRRTGRAHHEHALRVPDRSASHPSAPRAGCHGKSDREWRGGRRPHGVTSGPPPTLPVCHQLPATGPSILPSGVTRRTSRRVNDVLNRRVVERESRRYPLAQSGTGHRVAGHHPVGGASRRRAAPRWA